MRSDIHYHWLINRLQPGGGSHRLWGESEESGEEQRGHFLSQEVLIAVRADGFSPGGGNGLVTNYREGGGVYKTGGEGT